MLNLSELDSRTRTILDNHGFDSIPFLQFVEQLRGSGLDLNLNRLKCDIALPDDQEMTVLPPEQSDEALQLFRLGQEAIEQGQVGAVVLNGGMATRFGGGTKGVTKALYGRSFLELKLRQIENRGQGRVPAFLMNSFATHEATLQHLESLDLNCPVHYFTQMVSLRLTPQGELFLDHTGSPSLHATGHGDLPFALQSSGLLRQFIQRGGRFLTVSNVDNLAAGLHPGVIGAHIAGQKPVTVELVNTYRGDVGGFPALVNGKMCIVEAFRAPFSFNIDTIPVFNTNTFVFDAASLAEKRSLDWFAVLKKVGDSEAVQFERLVGQLTEFMDVTWLVVPRSSSASRFIPIKNPQDLELNQQQLEAVLRLQGAL